MSIPNEMKQNDGNSLEKAVGENANPFLENEATPAPVISEKSSPYTTWFKTHFCV